MAEKQDFNRQVRRTAVATVALATGLVFGLVLLIDGDWIPGAICVVATLIGLAAQAPVIRRLCSEGPSASAPRNKPAH